MRPTIVAEKPTTDLPDGLYRVIDAEGLYWGTFKVVTTWTGERTVIEWLY